VTHHRADAPFSDRSVTRLPWDVAKVAGFIPVTAEARGDYVSIAHVDGLLDRWAHPWRYADRAVWNIDPLPEITRLAHRWRRMRRRLADVVQAARYGIDNQEPK
jgi:hypothetical protein